MTMANYLDISTDSFKIHSIYEMEIIQEINEHSSLHLTAILNSEQKESDIYTTNENSRIKIYNKLEEKYIFIGLIKTLKIRNWQEVYYLEIDAVSITYLLDIKKECQSFQNKNLLYKDLALKIVHKYRGGQTIACQEASKKIDNLMIQFNETDWEFLKRLASHCNKGLIPDCKLDFPAIYFGEPAGTYRGALENGNFSVTKNINKYMEEKENGEREVFDIDFVTFQVEGTVAFEIGDFLEYKNARLYVQSVYAKFVKGELVYTCYLSSGRGLGRIKIFNKNIKGASIKGKVESVVNDKIKVHLSLDGEKPHDEEFWEFPYSTNYAAEGNTGWYCMPEKGDSVLIYFPSQNEGEGMGVNSLRENSKLEKVSDPKIKYFRTANGKELKFSPEEILITAASDENGGIYIRLNEENGIEISSTKPISITSSSDINIDSQKDLKIHADDKIILQCKSSKIAMDSLIDIIGKDVKIN